MNSELGTCYYNSREHTKDTHGPSFPCQKFVPSRPAAQPAVEGTMTAEQFEEKRGDTRSKIEQLIAQHARLAVNPHLHEEIIQVVLEFALRNPCAEIERLNRQIQQRDKCSFMGPMRNCPTHGESAEILRLTGLLNEANSNAEATAGEIAQLKLELRVMELRAMRRKR